jgi:hypothetical protein
MAVRRRRGQAVRDSIIFGVGIAGIIYETVFQQVDRPTLLVLFAAMVGLPAFLRGDEYLNVRRERDDVDSPRR